MTALAASGNLNANTFLLLPDKPLIRRRTPGNELLRLADLRALELNRFLSSPDAKLSAGRDEDVRIFSIGESD